MCLIISVVVLSFGPYPVPGCTIYCLMEMSVCRKGGSLAPPAGGQCPVKGASARPWIPRDSERHLQVCLQRNGQSSGQGVRSAQTWLKVTSSRGLERSRIFQNDAESDGLRRSGPAQPLSWGVLGTTQGFTTTATY